MSRKVAITKISKREIEKVLNNGFGDFGIRIRPDHKLKDIRILRVDDSELNNALDQVALTITSPDLPEVKTGEAVPIIFLYFRQERAEPTGA